MNDQNPKEPFSGLEQVPWKDLTHANGPATDVPPLLRSLCSPDEEDRESAAFELFESLWDQGTVYEATLAAVPFMLQLLKHESTPDPSLVACLLASIASGCGYMDADEEAEESESYEDAQAGDVVTRVLESIEEGLPLLIPFLGDDDPETRSSLACALGAFLGHAESHILILENALQEESDEEVQEEIENAILRLTLQSNG